MAIQYGMSAHEFWHEDKQLFNSYRRAYYTRLSEESWVNGLYFDIALNNLAGNICRKKGEKELKYPNEPLELFKENEKKITPTNVEQNFRELMMRSTNWLKSRNNTK